MQSTSLVTPRFTKPIDDIFKFFRKGVVAVCYVRLEILNGFSVLVHKFSDRSAMLTYSSRGRKIFKYHIDVNDLDEFFAMLEYHEQAESEQQFIIGRFEFRISSIGDDVSIGIEHSSHDVEITGPRTQLKTAILDYRNLRRSPRRMAILMRNSSSRPH